MLELNIGYPTRRAEIEILETHGRTTTLLKRAAAGGRRAEQKLGPKGAVEGVGTVHVADTLKRYIASTWSGRLATTPTWPLGPAWRAALAPA